MWSLIADLSLLYAVIYIRQLLYNIDAPTSDSTVNHYRKSPLLHCNYADLVLIYCKLFLTNFHKGELCMVRQLRRLQLLGLLVHQVIVRS